MTLLVSPAEPKALREVGTVAAITEDYGADILIPGNGYFIGVQRKQFPGDFISSMSDGRLQTSLVKLMKTDVRILLLEGEPHWSPSGALSGEGGYLYSLTKDQLRGILMSAHFELGVHSIWTTGMSDTIAALEALEKWAGKGSHNSLFTRPGITKQGLRKHSHRDQAVHFLQGFEGIGPELAGQIFDHFGRVPFELSVTLGELGDVKGMGPKRIEKIEEMLS